MKPVVSVIICTRNRRASLRRTLIRLLTAIRKETSRHGTEVIIVDNGSSDGTQQVVRHLQKAYPTCSIRFIYEPAVGVSIARNKGVRQSKASTVVFLDDDTIISRGWIRMIHTLLATSPHRIITGTIQLDRTFRKTTLVRMLKRYDSLWSMGTVDHGTKARILPPTYLVFLNNTLIPKSVFRRVGYFDTQFGSDSGTTGGEDIDFFQRVLVHNIPVYYEPALIVTHAVSAYKRSWTYLTLRYYQNGKEIALFTNKHNLQPVSRLRRLFARLYYRIMRMMLPHTGDGASYYHWCLLQYAFFTGYEEGMQKQKRIRNQKRTKKYLSISVLVVTRNRPVHIRNLIWSLQKNKRRDIEIIIVDQSSDTKTKHAVRAMRDARIVYVPMIKRGKARGLNLGLTYVRGSIVAFTDDDCIVSPRWLTSIQHTFDTHPHVGAVFGAVKPYLPGTHTGHICPATFPVSDPQTHHTPKYHARFIGLGNNMAIRTSVLRDTGGFRPWLGPGSVGSNAEDAEIALRLLLYGISIRTTPRVMVYHDRWLTQKERDIQELSYLCGEMACYEYLHMQGFRFASPVVMQNLRISLWRVKRMMHPGNRHIVQWFSDVGYELRRVLALIQGDMVGRYYAFKEPMLITRITNRNPV